MGLMSVFKLRITENKEKSDKNLEYREWNQFYKQHQVVI